MVENFRNLHTRLEQIEFLMQEDGLSNLGIIKSRHIV
jgi:hypothetical protein